MSKNKLMFILDLDKTTIRKDWSLPQNNIEAVRKAKEEGHIVSIVTGRPTAGAIMFHKKLELNTLMGVLNGNGLYNPDKGSSAQVAMLDSKPFVEFIKQEKTMDIPVDFAYQAHGQIHSTHNIVEIMSKWYHNRAWEVLDPKKSVPDHIECAFITIDNKHSQYLENYFEQYEDSITIHKWGELKGGGLQVYEFFNAKHTKGTIIKEIMQHYEIPIENVYIFGDGRNDIPMFKIGQNTFAVANAHEELKNIASEVLPHTNEEGGVGIKIMEILNNK